MTTNDSEDVPARQRDAERTKRELLEVATTVFAEVGFAGARVDEIARMLGGTKITARTRDHACEMLGWAG